MSDKTIEDLIKNGREAKQLNDGSIIIATQFPCIDYEKLIKSFGGEVLTLGGNGHAFNPFKDADPAQIEDFINAYCEPYPEKYRDIIREKVRKEIEEMKKE